jgi:hypothetical protein
MIMSQGPAKRHGSGVPWQSDATSGGTVASKGASTQGVMMPQASSRTAAVVLVAAFAIAACGAQRAAQATPSARGQNAPAAFTARARTVTAQWDLSRAARLWRTGLVLMDASELSPIPHNAGFSSESQKAAFESGRFRLTGTLPAGQAAGLVHWADGSTLRLPSLTALAAFTELATPQPCGDPAGCGQLAVTGAQPGTVTVLTSRGPASVPAWHFTVAGLSWQATQVAIAPGALAVQPVTEPIPAAGRNTEGVSELTAVSADGRTLTFSFIGGACDTAWGGYRYESSTTVVAGSWEQWSAGDTPCPAVGVFRTIHVRLARPLGTRVVLDVASGRPLVIGLQIP